MCVCAQLQVALLFLAQDSMANDAVWSAFFTAAAQMHLQPTVAAAAAAEAQSLDQAAAVGGYSSSRKMSHPDVGSYPGWIYPGYKIQHGLTTGAEPVKTVHSDNSSPGSSKSIWKKASQNTAGNRSPSTIGGSTREFAAFPAAAYAWESERLSAAVQQLLVAQHSWSKADSTTAQTAAAAGQRREQQQQQQGRKPLPVLKQLSTLHEALAEGAGDKNRAQQRLMFNRSVLNQKHLHQLGKRTNERCCQLIGSRPAGTDCHQVTDFNQQQQQGQDRRQSAFFSVYVHTPAGMLLPRSSAFSGCELVVRLNTTRGYAQHVLAEAEALLLAAALSDPLNTKFVLVSETSIPLYPPQVRGHADISACCWLSCL